MAWRPPDDLRAASLRSAEPRCSLASLGGASLRSAGRPRFARLEALRALNKAFFFSYKFRGIYKNRGFPYGIRISDFRFPDFGFPISDFGFLYLLKLITSGVHSPSSKRISDFRISGFPAGFPDFRISLFIKINWQCVAYSVLVCLLKRNTHENDTLAPQKTRGRRAGDTTRGLSGCNYRYPGSGLMTLPPIDVSDLLRFSDSNCTK